MAGYIQSEQGLVRYHQGASRAPAMHWLRVREPSSQHIPLLKEFVTYVRHQAFHVHTHDKKVTCKR